MKKKFYLNPASFVSSLGKVQSLQNSIIRCTRCNSCLQSCPSYLLKPEETSSPRGRVQLLRLILERKIKPEDHTELIQKTLGGCLLCGKCSLACAGDIPVAQQVLCLSKEMGLNTVSSSFKLFWRAKENFPKFFDFFVRFIQFLRRWKMFTVFGISKTSSFYWVRFAHRTLPAPKRSLKATLKKMALPLSCQKPDFIYLPSLEACYIEPEIGQKTLQILGNKNIHILFQTSCGLFEYMYGDHARCLTQAKTLLTRWEKLSDKQAPLVTDSWEVFAFLKNYPTLFASLPNWQKRAENFSAHIRFISDYIKPKRSTIKVKTAMDYSGLLFLPLENISFTRRILKTQAGKNLLECDYSRFPTALGGAVFARPLQTEKVLLEQVNDIARQQLEQVYCLSGWAAFMLSAALKQQKLTTQAQHIVFLQDQHD